MRAVLAAGDEAPGLLRDDRRRLRAREPGSPKRARPRTHTDVPRPAADLPVRVERALRHERKVERGAADGAQRVRHLPARHACALREWRAQRRRAETDRRRGRRRGGGTSRLWPARSGASGPSPTRRLCVEYEHPMRRQRASADQGGLARATEMASERRAVAEGARRAG
jgi:hypothetical protein